MNIEQILDATVLSLSKLAEFRDPETGYHLERISHYSSLLAEEYLKRGVHTVDEQFIKDIAKASILHGVVETFLDREGDFIGINERFPDK